MRFQPDPVPVPTQGVVINRTGEYRYVYHVLRSYRNENGTPANDKVSIGAIVKGSDTMLIPNQRYFELYPTPKIEIPEGAPRNLELLESTMMGGSFLVSRVLQDLGVSKILLEVLGTSRAEAVISIASYMACPGNIIENIEYWSKNFSLNHIISPTKASLIFSTITFKKK
jgi:hypothetical protein